MRCPKCEKEVGMVDICPLCGEKTITGEDSEMITPSASDQKTTSFENGTLAIDELQEKEKFTLKSPRTFVEAVAIILFTIILLYSCASGGNYNELSKEKNALSDKYSELSKNYDSLEKYNGHLEEQYDAYKEKMQPYEDMADAEAEAKKIEADKIIAEKKVADEKAAAEKKAADEKAAAEAMAEADRKAAETLSQKNALSQAAKYLRNMSFSHESLIEQLLYEGYSTEDATYAADNCGANWNEQAAKRANSYMDSMAFSRDSLIDQLLYEGFSQEQAEYGVSAVGY